MADSKISQLTSYTTPVAADVLPIVDTANTTTKKVAMSDLFNILSSLFTIKDSSDTTKKVAFNLSGLTTATTRTVTMPDSDFTPVGTTLTQTLTNKTISTGTKINTSGADATGGLYYRDSSGNLTYLGIGSNLQILQSNGTIPAWVSNPSAAQASYSTAGIVQGLTDAATSGLTFSAGVISVNSGTGANQIVKRDGSGNYPAGDGSAITNISGFLTSGAPGTTVSNATTTVLTYALAGGILSTNKGVRIRMSTSVVNTAVNGTFTCNIKYGGTTISTFGYGGVSGTPTFTSIFVADILLMGSGATGTQRANGIITQAGTSFASVGIPTQGSSSIDSTISQNIVIEFVSNNAAVVATFSDYFLQKVS